MSKNDWIHVRINADLRALIDEYTTKNPGSSVSSIARDAIRQWVTPAVAVARQSETHEATDIDEPARNILARFGWRARGGGND